MPVNKVAGSNGRRTTQKVRRLAQWFSVFINLWIGLQFFLFAKYIESGGRLWEIPRPPGVEGWLPIGALVSLLHYFYSGEISGIHPAGLVIFVVIIGTAFLFKKGFCSWVCPIGFLSEILGNLSDKFFGKRVKPPEGLDYFLRSLKYLILAFFIWALVIEMNAEAIAGFLNTDYNKITDFLMLRFFTDISSFALAILGLLFALSLIIRGFWCRYLCPYGALLGLFSLVSPTRIVRNKTSCTGCTSCAGVCPAFIKVDKVDQVVSDECSGCMACVDVCPVSNTLQLAVVKRQRKVSSIKWAALLLVFFWGSLFAAKLWGPWENNITNEEYMRHMPGVAKGQYLHP